MHQRELHDQGGIGERRPWPRHGPETFAEAKEHRHDHRQHPGGEDQMRERAKAER